MNKVTVLFLLIIFGIGNAVSEQSVIGEGQLKVEKIVVGTGIEDKKLVGESAGFDISVERVWCWTNITAQKLPAMIKHIWYLEDEKMAEVPLNIKYPSHRTWSSKAVSPGKWAVKVVDKSGEVFASREFVVGERIRSEAIESEIPKRKIQTTGLIQVVKMALAAQIKDKEPVSESMEFDSAVGRVWCWNRILAKSFPTAIKHVWYADKKKVGEVSLKIKAQTYRTWSSKTVWPGEWRVEVVSEDDKLLAARGFVVHK
ncbi:DUF2914 domain-containing protein [Elusimicrobiota bacterium]